MSEETIFYTTNPDYLEKVQSQLPALQLLIQMGWNYLTPEECVNLRDGRLGSVILEPILLEHIRTRCRFTFKGSTRPFTENAMQNAIQILKNYRATGATHQNEEVYDLLCLGTSVPQTVDGDTKSFNVDYIDWKNPANNTFHCTAEFKVERAGLQKHYIPDIVLFINGIPVVVMECKRNAYTDQKKEPIDLAIAQLLTDYQAKDGIPQLFLYTQLTLALARSEAKYGTTKTEPGYWAVWKESGQEKRIQSLIHASLPSEQENKLLSAPFASTATAFRQLAEKKREVYEQDRTLYGLCRPERLLELMYKFIVFDNGIKKIARYQQFFTVQDILKRASKDAAPRERGGVVWHTQGSGKSITMVIVAKSLALASTIRNPKVVLVTDRIDLDDQICDTFRACGLKTGQATTGQNLVDLLEDDGVRVMTTLIQKFAAATKKRSVKEAPPNTFVLVDEAHRGHYSEQHARMKLAMKGATYIAFTGTPLAKNAKKNTFIQFGDMFRPAYTIKQAVADGAVVPLLYEARHVPQPVEQKAIDSWFSKVTLGLNEDEKADLKRKFATEDQLNQVEQKIRMVAWDISQHYASTYQGTGMKGQLVTPNKSAALLYKRCLDEFGQLTSEVLISGPSEAEGDSTATAKVPAEVQSFWDDMMERHGSEKNYNKHVINAFKRGDEPEIIIVVDKLLTGFDAPCNTVLYLARKLKEHTLLQAIARVNRLYPGKDYGWIIDYSGVVEELDDAIWFYDQLADFSSEDLDSTVTYIQDKAAELPQLHSNLWELFQSIRGSSDPEVYELHLRDEELRAKFYDRFNQFARVLGLALASTTFLENTPEETIRRYKDDLKFFRNLRAAASLRFQERIDFSKYETSIKKLLDTHVGAGEIQSLGHINLLDHKHRRELMDDDSKSADAKADMIASATRHIIERDMGKDKRFYERFSKMLDDVLHALYEKKIKALEALQQIEDMFTKVSTHTDEEVPEQLIGKDMARRYYGNIQEPLVPYFSGREDELATVATAIVERIDHLKIRDWRENIDVLNRMRGEIDDLFFESASELGFEIPLELQDKLIDECIEIAIANED